VVHAEHLKHVANADEQEECTWPWSIASLNVHMSCRVRAAKYTVGCLRNVLHGAWGRC